MSGREGYELCHCGDNYLWRFVTLRNEFIWERVWGKMSRVTVDVWTGESACFRLSVFSSDVSLSFFNEDEEVIKATVAALAEQSTQQGGSGLKMSLMGCADPEYAMILLFDGGRSIRLRESRVTRIVSEV